MHYLFELSGEHPNLPKAEVLACIEAEGYPYEILEDDEGILIIDGALDLNRLKERLALSRYIDKWLFSSSPAKLKRKAQELRIPNGTFCVRAKHIGTWQRDLNTIEVEKTIGEVLAEKNKVDLKDPDVEVRIVLSSKCYVGFKQIKIERGGFEERRAQHRPFFSPISLHPRLARALVNLSRIRKKETLLDPFCGTGGILIEGGLIGAKLIGSDIAQHMIDGCKRNLEHFGISAKLFESDIGDILKNTKEVDAIATDPPYGRATSTHQEEIKELYARAFEVFSKILKEDGHLAIVLPDKEFIKMGKEFFDLREVYPVRIHRSLTRNFCVFSHY